MSLRIPVVSLAAASSRSPLADDAVCQLKDNSKHTNPCFCQTHKHNFVKKYHWLTTRTNLARRSIEAAPGITKTCTTCPIALSLRSEHWCVTLERKFHLEVWFLPLSQLDLFPNAECCWSSTNLIEAMNLLDGTWPSAPGPRIQFWRLDEITEVPYFLMSKGPNLYQDRWPSKHLTLLGCLVQPGVLEVTLIIPVRSLSIFLIYV